MSLVNFEKFDFTTKLESQRALFKECFPENNGTLVESVEHYLWKFQSLNEQVHSYEYSAHLGNELVGYYAAIPYIYKWNSACLNAAMVCDVMTGVNARGKGVFTKLGIYSTNQFKKAGFDFSTGYPIRKEVIPGHLKAGWEVLFDLPMYGRFIKFDSYLKKKRLSLLAFPLNFLWKTYTSILKLIHYQKELKKLTIEYYKQDQIHTIQGFEDFIESWNLEIPIGLIKDINFLRWRLGAPEKEYNILIMRDENKIIGYSITRCIEKEDVPCLGILDFYVLKHYAFSAGKLNQFIINDAVSKGVELILVMMSSIYYRNYQFKKMGYLKTPFNFSFIVKIFNKELDWTFLKNKNNWHLMWIDSDDL